MIPTLMLLIAAQANRPDIVAPQIYSVGVSKVDVTPKYPVRLHGFGFRRAESEGVQQRIWVKGMAIGDEQPFVLLVADSLGVPRRMTESVAKKLAARGLSPDRLCICATHTHTAPMLVGIAPTIFGMDLPPDHAAHIEQYTREFEDALVNAAEAALADRKPSTLTWGVGTLGLSKNRRTPGGPVDHDLPVMFVRDQQGRIRATFSSYACHCVTLSFNRISGDWAGCAAEALETIFPDSIALLAVGCGADSNPSSGVTGDKWDVAMKQGRDYAAEVERLSRGFLAPMFGAMSSQCKENSLPLADMPPAEDWAKKSTQKGALGHHARVQQKRLAAKQPLKNAVDYQVCVWRWGDQLAMGFLPGEVVVDYSLRLKNELDRGRLWLNAYSNDDPCYIPSERVLKEGGYEGETAMLYYDLPTKFKPGLENAIVDTVKECAGAGFRAPFDAKKTATLPRSPQQSLSDLRIGGDLAVDLVAAEPLVIDPVAISFGPDGKLWVAEMNDYPSGGSPKEPGGRIRFLEDTDGDGVFDKSTTFLTGIPFPTGVTVWRKGVFVCAAPDILYAEDTDGDGKADVVKKVFTGFATHNFQARVNSLEYGLDGWLYGSCGIFGGNIANERGQVVHLGHRDFRCKPDLGIIEPVAGSSQQGRVRNDWGDWFGCDNTNLGWHFPLPAEVLSRNPHVTTPLNRVSLPDAAASVIAPASNLQMFALSGPVGRATAACGIGVYRDAKLGSQYYDDFFTCEPVHNAVHRMKFERNGSSFVGRKPPEEPGREFLASTDAWFRPVQVRTGTDGSLWVVDMYRYIIEHPMWIPPEEHARHDLRAGSTMGRIYRVRSKNDPPKPLPKINAQPTTVPKELASANGPLRDLAMQEVLWNRPKASASRFRELLESAESPAAKLQVYCALESLGDVDVLHRLQLPTNHAQLRRHLIRAAAAHFPDDAESKAIVLKGADDQDPAVRLEAAIDLGGLHVDSAADKLASLLDRGDADTFLRAAALSSINADNVVRATSQALKLDAPPEVVRALVATAVGYGKETQLGFVGTLDQSSSATAFAALEGLLQGLKRAKGPANDAAGLTSGLEYAVAAAMNGQDKSDHRIACLRLFGWQSQNLKKESAAIETVMNRSESAPIHSATIEAAGRVGSALALRAVAGAWTRLSPTQRNSALDVLLQSPVGVSILLDSLSSRKISIGDVDVGRRNRIVQHSDEKIRTAAAALFGPLLADRTKVLETYASVEKISGDADKGKAVFAKNCAGCHRLDDVGFAVGPDLATVALKPANYLLMEILDPNRNLDARYIGYIALAADGRTITGLLAGETDSSVTLLSQDGRKTELLRSEIEKIAATGKSLMPEGLEQQISPPQMADLLAYVKHRLPPPKAFHGNTPMVVAMKDGAYALHARFAELRGPNIRFEVPQFAAGYWHSPEDFAAWEIEVAAPGRFQVELEYGCTADSAGNSFRIECDGRTIDGKAASTGGWEQFKRVRVGELELNAGRRRLTLKPLGDRINGALLDLRAVYLTPAR